MFIGSTSITGRNGNSEMLCGIFAFIVGCLSIYVFPDLERDYEHLSVDNRA